MTGRMRRRASTGADDARGGLQAMGLEVLIVVVLVVVAIVIAAVAVSVV